MPLSLSKSSWGRAFLKEVMDVRKNSRSPSCRLPLEQRSCLSVMYRLWGYCWRIREIATEKHNRHFPSSLLLAGNFKRRLTVNGRQSHHVNGGTPPDTRIVNSFSVRPLEIRREFLHFHYFARRKNSTAICSNSRSSTIETDPHEDWSSSCRFIRRHEEIEDRCIAKQQF